MIFLFPHISVFLFFLIKKNHQYYINYYKNKKKNEKMKYEIFISNYFFFKDLFEMISISKKIIYIEFYIIRNDNLGKIFLELLKYKSKFCKVIIIIDAVGSKDIVKDKYLHFYNNNIFNINMRNHRKIVYLDNNILYLGSSNVGREYLSLDTGIGYWSDCVIKINFNININNNYYVINKNFIKNNIKIYYSKNYMIYLNNNLKLLRFLCLKIKNFFLIVTPYVILDKKMLELLIILREKKVRIIIVLSDNTDNYIVHSASLLFAKLLKNLKIEFYYFDNYFNHKKIYLIDYKIVIIGSMNFDVRSIYINLESILLVSDKSFIKNLIYKISKKFSLSKLFFYKKRFFVKVFYLISFINYLLL